MSSLLFSRFSDKFYPPTSNPSRQLLQAPSPEAAQANPKGRGEDLKGSEHSSRGKPPAAGERRENGQPRASLPAVSTL